LSFASGDEKRVIIIIFFFFFGGVAVFDYLSIFFGFLGEVLILGSRPAPGFKMEAPCNSRCLSR
jgi:hypothetical protein